MAGFTTVHAGSAGQALSRLRFVCQLADEAANLTTGTLTTLVADAIDVVVHCDRTTDGPRVVEVVAVEDLAATGSGAFTTTPLLGRAAPDRPLTWSGAMPVRLRDALTAHGIDLTGLLAPGADRP